MKKTVAALICCFSIFYGESLFAACDLCAIYRSIEAKSTKPGFHLGVFEQFTHFGTLQQDGRKVDNEFGQKIDSSVTQFLAGYQFNDSFGMQLNIPYIRRSFTRPADSGIDKGTEAGLGDLALIGSFRLYQDMTEESVFLWNVYGGVKFPTGSTDRLREELAMPGMEMGAVHGHVLALGSGSYDGIVGTSLFGRWERLFVTADIQYKIRSRGDFDYRYANDLVWHVKPGGYLWLSPEGTLGLQLAVSGEDKGKDDLAGVAVEATGISSVFIGPEFSLTWKENLSAELGAEFPVVNDNSGLQLVPDYRVKAALTWRF